MRDKDLLSNEDVALNPDSSIAYLAMSMLCSNTNSLVPELLYIFKTTQITDFIKVFSGETIKVPTLEEYEKVMLTALACYHTVIQGKSFDWFAIKYELTGITARGVQARLDHWLKGLNPGDRRLLDKIKVHEDTIRRNAKKMKELLKETSV